MSDVGPPEERPDATLTRLFVAAAILVGAPFVVLGLRASIPTVPSRIPARRSMANVRPARPMRDIRVRIACDEEFRALPDWESTARARLAAASREYEEAFQIRWVAADVVEWKSDDAAASVNDLCTALVRDVGRGAADVVVGFSGQLRAKGAEREYEKTGVGCFYGPAAVVRQTGDGASEEWQRFSLVHELGHVMGAWHSSDPASFMRPGGDGRRRFDPQTLRAVEALRDLDFAKGLDGVDDGRRRVLADIYRSGHARGAMLPYAREEVDRAWTLRSAGKIAEGRALARHALAEQGACVPADDPTLVPALRETAHSLLEEPDRDLDEAERLALRARDICAKAPDDETPLFDSRFIVADIAGRRGRYAEAIDEMRRIREARERKYGKADADTVYAQACIEYWETMAASAKSAPK